MEQELIKLGLSEKEAKVYLALLELSEETVQNIATKAGVNRATTYVILEKLIKLGLASQIQNDKKTLFVAEDPKELVNILEEEKRQIDSRKQYLDDAMNQLQAVYNRNKEKPIVRFFEGGDGLQALDRYGTTQVAAHSEMLGISPIDLVEEQFPTRRKTAVSDRIKKGIRSRAIYTHKNGEIPGFSNEKELREAIFLPREIWPLSVSISIYPDWGVKFSNFEPNNHFGVLLQSPAVARNMKELFELAWEGALVRREKYRQKQARN